LSDTARIEAVLSEAGYEGIGINPVSASSQLGATMDDAIDFTTQLMPAAVALQSSDPEQAAALRADLASALGQWSNEDGVAPPSAAYVVTANRPG
jgi:hypothetical protein